MTIPELKKMHNDILLGLTNAKDLSDDDLVEVHTYRHEFHFIAVVAYDPDFTVRQICDKEITRRREERLGETNGDN